MKKQFSCPFFAHRFIFFGSLFLFIPIPWAIRDIVIGKASIGNLMVYLLGVFFVGMIALLAFGKALTRFYIDKKGIHTFSAEICWESIETYQTIQEQTNSRFLPWFSTPKTFLVFGKPVKSVMGPPSRKSIIIPLSKRVMKQIKQCNGDQFPVIQEILLRFEPMDNF